jgi:hypothetical protein
MDTLEEISFKIERELLPEFKKLLDRDPGSKKIFVCVVEFQRPLEVKVYEAVPGSTLWKTVVKDVVNFPYDITKHICWALIYKKFTKTHSLLVLSGPKPPKNEETKLDPKIEDGWPRIFEHRKLDENF